MQLETDFIWHFVLMTVDGDKLFVRCTLYRGKVGKPKWRWLGGVKGDARVGPLMMMMMMMWWWKRILGRGNSKKLLLADKILCGLSKWWRWWTILSFQSPVSVFVSRFIFTCIMVLNCMLLVTILEDSFSSKLDINLQFSLHREHIPCLLQSAVG